MRTTILVCVMLLVQTVLCWVGWNRNPHWSDENGLMENFQVTMLLLGIIVCLWKSVQVRERAQRILCGSLALFFVNFIVLEVDTRGLDSLLLKKLFNGRIRDLWLGTLWLCAVVLFIKNRVNVWNRFLVWLRSNAGRYMLAAGALWVLSQLCDKLHLFPNSNHFYEELPEVNAAVLMLVSALLTRKGEISSQPAPGASGVCGTS